MSDKVIEKLKKILALAREGVGGERINAEEMLNALLKKHGLSLSDLEDDFAEPEFFWVSIKNKIERRLFLQCVAAAVPDWGGSSYSNQIRGTKAVGIKVTKSQWMEIDLMFSVHRKSFDSFLKKQQENLFIAYIHKNNIFPSKPSESASDSNLDPADLLAISQMMNVMSKTPVYKSIPA